MRIFRLDPTFYFLFIFFPFLFFVNTARFLRVPCLLVVSRSAVIGLSFTRPPSKHGREFLSRNERAEEKSPALLFPARTRPARGGDRGADSSHPTFPVPLSFFCLFVFFFFAFYIYMSSKEVESMKCSCARCYLKNQYPRRRRRFQHRFSGSFSKR